MTKNKIIKPKPQNFERCLNYVLFLLNRREYSLKEIKNKLNEYAYHPEDIEKILKYIVEKNYQSDERFAFNYVRNKKTKYGKIKLKQELLNKGIDINLIEEVFFKHFETSKEVDDNCHYAFDILNKKFPNLEDLKLNKEMWFKKDKPKVIRFMLSRGFSLKDFKDYI